MPSSRIVVTFASNDFRALPWLVEGETEREGMPVVMPAGMEGEVRTPPIIGRKALGGTGIGPELWSVIQVVVHVGGDVAIGAVGGLLADWIIERRKAGKDQAARPPDRLTLNVYVNEVRVDASADEVAAAVRDAIEETYSDVDVPTEVRRNNAAALQMTLDEYDDFVGG
ncbi:MAG TPA: hypothetical protein VFI15_04785 [Candidatus Limnocylindrales bacterium]|nr:hypothetical protein [Candidatus Limnocylindrales bacterium]